MVPTESHGTETLGVRVQGQYKLNFIGMKSLIKFYEENVWEEGRVKLSFWWLYRINRTCNARLTEPKGRIMFYL